MPKWEDGNPMQARSEAKAEKQAARERDQERSVRERDSSLGLRERPEPPDLLGLRLSDDKPSLADQYGVRLMDRDQSNALTRLKDDADKMIDRLSREDWRAERSERTPASEAGPGPSCSYTPVLGLGPTIDTGNGNLGLDIPLSNAGGLNSWKDIKLGWSINPTVSMAQDGNGGFDRSLGLGVGYGLPFGLAGVSVDGNYQYDRPGTSAIEVEGTLLGYTCRIGIEANQVTRQFDRAAEEAARGASPYILDALRKLGLPTVP